MKDVAEAQKAIEASLSIERLDLMALQEIREDLNGDGRLDLALVYDVGIKTWRKTGRGLVLYLASSDGMELLMSASAQNIDVSTLTLRGQKLIQVILQGQNEECMATEGYASLYRIHDRTIELAGRSYSRMTSDWAGESDRIWFSVFDGKLWLIGTVDSDPGRCERRRWVKSEVQAPLDEGPKAWKRFSPTPLLPAERERSDFQIRKKANDQFYIQGGGSCGPGRGNELKWQKENCK